MYNLREDNRQLRKSHQDIYTQLLDVQVRESTKDSVMHYVIRVSRKFEFACSSSVKDIEYCCSVCNPKTWAFTILDVTEMTVIHFFLTISGTAQEPASFKRSSLTHITRP